MQSVCLQTTVVFIGVAYHNGGGGGGGGHHTLYIDFYCCYVLFGFVFDNLFDVRNLFEAIYILCKLYLVCIEHVKNNL